MMDINDRIKGSLIGGAYKETEPILPRRKNIGRNA